MKKIIRVLGITLLLIVLETSCSKDDDNGSGNAITINNLKGNYKIIGASLQNTVDLNNDRVLNNNLLQEGFISPCTVDR